MLWSIVFALCLGIEIAVPALVSIWFALAALITFFVALFVEDLVIQLVVFSVLSLIFLLLLRGYCQQFIKTKDRMRQEEVLVLRLTREDSGGVYYYDVRYKGAVWTGISRERFQENDKVVIKSFDGNKIQL